MNKKIIPNHIVKVPSSLDTSFFKYWLMFLRPFHKMTEREMQIAAEFLKQRHLLSKDITNQSLLDEVVLNSDTKKKIIQTCGLSYANFQIVLGNLKKAKFIVNNKINMKFIPHIKEEENNFQLLLVFDL